MSANLIDEVWGAARPERPNNKLIVLDQKYAGKPFAEKLENLRKEMEKKKSLGFVVSMLDEIAWLYNLRGSEYVVSCFFPCPWLCAPGLLSAFIKLSSESPVYLLTVSFGIKHSIQPRFLLLRLYNPYGCNFIHRLFQAG